jgi:hypothetical protein
VAAIDTGDVAKLERLVGTTPALVRERLAAPGAWLRDTVGRALDGFFRRPYLLWFVAEDPVRNGRLPENIAEVARVIIDAARRESTSNPPLATNPAAVSGRFCKRTPQVAGSRLLVTIYLTLHAGECAGRP